MEQQKVVRSRTTWPPPVQEVANFGPSRRTRSRRFKFSGAVRSGNSEESMTEEEGEKPSVPVSPQPLPRLLVKRSAES